MREEDEIARVEAFCLKKDWVPRFSINSPLKFLRQQEEEMEQKKKQQEKERRDAMMLARSKSSVQ